MLRLLKCHLFLADCGMLLYVFVSCSRWMKRLFLSEIAFFESSNNRFEMRLMELRKALLFALYETSFTLTSCSEVIIKSMRSLTNLI